MFSSVPTFCIFCFGFSFLTKPICHSSFQGLALSNTVLQFVYFFSCEEYIAWEYRILFKDDVQRVGATHRQTTMT